MRGRSIPRWSLFVLAWLLLGCPAGEDPPPTDPPAPSEVPGDREFEPGEGRPLGERPDAGHPFEPASTTERVTRPLAPAHLGIEVRPGPQATRVAHVISPPEQASRYVHETGADGTVPVPGPPGAERWLAPEAALEAVAADDRLAEASDDGVHAPKEGPFQSKYVPPDWWHETHERAASWYFRPGMEHATEEGEDTSKYVPGDWIHRAEHADQRSKYVPPWYEHATQDGPEKSMYWPDYFGHKAVDGPDKSRYYIRSWVHWPGDGYFKSRHVPPDFRHITTGDTPSYFEDPGGVIDAAIGTPISP